MNELTNPDGTEPEPRPRAPRLRTPRRAVAVVAIGSLSFAGLAACGRPAQDVSTRDAGPAGSATVGAPSAGPNPANPADPGTPASSAAGSASLPTLPGAQVREPERFDAQGCIQVSATASDCNQRAAQLDVAAAGATTEDWRTLAGFVGRWYSNDQSSDTAVVVEPSVTVRPSPTGAWSAVGLARNDHPRVLGGLDVEATLLDGAGGELEVVRASSPVTSIRPGEPVPFSLDAAHTPAAAVAGVTWRVVEHEAGGDASARVLELATYWTRPAGDARPIDFYLHHDAPGAPTAYLLFGSVVNRGRAVTSPRVVVAWLGADGRVTVVREAPVAEPSGAAVARLDAGAARDVLLVVDDPADGELAGAAAPMMWGVAS